MLGFATRVSIANNPVVHSGIIGRRRINGTIPKVVPRY
jgi:hypothetical protein